MPASNDRPSPAFEHDPAFEHEQEKAELVFPPSFVEGLLGPLFSEPERAQRAVALLGAPLALACLDRVPQAPLERETLRAAAQVEAVEAKGARGRLLDFCRTLLESRIPFVAFKGLATSLCLYPKPYYRLVPDADLLFHQSDLSRLVELLARLGFETRLEPSTIRRWGALTVASFAPVAPKGGAYLIDVHRLVDDPPAGRGLPTGEIFRRAVEPDHGPGWLKVPCPEHAFVILALHAYRDLYEPRGLKSLFDALFLLSAHSLDWPEIERLARRGRFVNRLLFYRELLARLGIADDLPLFRERVLSAAQERLKGYVAENYRRTADLRVPDSIKLALEFSLLDSPFDTVKRNLGRLIGLVRRRVHTLPGLPIARPEGL